MTTPSPNYSRPFPQSMAVAVAFVSLIVATWGSLAGRREVPARPSEVRVTLYVENGLCRFVPEGNAVAEDATDPRQLTIVSGASVHLRVESRDYVYFLKQAGLSLDVPAIPETVFEASFTAPEPGRYELALSPICGLPWEHAEPPGTILVTSH